VTRITGTRIALHHPIGIRHLHLPPLPPAPPARPTPLGRVLEVGVELLVAAGISFGFFALFLVNLAIVFPSGLSLETLATQLQAKPRAMTRPGAQAPASARSAPAAEAIARLGILRATVRSKPANAITWSPASDGQELWDRDGVQTGSAGRARLDFGPGGELVLGPNSLIIVSAGALAADGRRDGGAVLVQDGEIWARFDEAIGPPPRIAVGGAVLEPGHGPDAGTAAEFRIHARREGGSTIAVIKGSLEVGTGARRIRLEAGQFGHVSAAGTVAPARELPPTPRPIRPAGEATFRYRRIAPQIEFRWAEIPRATRYRLVVAREGPERTFVVDERVAWPALTVGRLDAGRYQWRVTALYGEVEGLPSAWRTVAVVTDGQAPEHPSDAAPPPVQRRGDSLGTGAAAAKRDVPRGNR
jgi:hypothetical protein